MSLRLRRSAFTAGLVNTADDGVPHVLEDLRQAILNGDEPPGTPIPIDQVGQFFGVSQIPVREALKILTGEGLVEHVPHRGYSVAQVSFEEFTELYVVREALEAAALRSAVSRVGPVDEQGLAAIHADLGDAVERGDNRAYHLLSRRFHLTLISTSAMQRLVRMYESAWNVTEPTQPMALVTPDDRRQFQGDHARILAALAARDADRLVAESARHYANLRECVGRVGPTSISFVSPARNGDKPT